MFGPRRSLQKRGNDGFVAAQSFEVDAATIPAFIGRFQQLKDVSHPNLCELIEIRRGKGDKLFVIEEHGEELAGIVGYVRGDVFR